MYSMSLCMITFVNELKKVYDILKFIPKIKQTNHDKTELPMLYYFIFIVVKSCIYGSLHYLSLDARLLITSLVSSIFSYVSFIYQSQRVKLRVMVFNATFNSISVISWRSVLLVGNIGEPGIKHQPVASH